MDNNLINAFISQDQKRKKLNEITTLVLLCRDQLKITSDRLAHSMATIPTTSVDVGGLFTFEKIICFLKTFKEIIIFIFLQAVELKQVGWNQERVMH